MEAVTQNFQKPVIRRTSWNSLLIIFRRFTLDLFHIRTTAFKHIDQQSQFNLTQYHVKKQSKILWIDWTIILLLVRTVLLNINQNQQHQRICWHIEKTLLNWQFRQTRKTSKMLFKFNIQSTMLIISHQLQRIKQALTNTCTKKSWFIVKIWKMKQVRNYTVTNICNKTRTQNKTFQSWWILCLILKTCTRDKPWKSEIFDWIFKMHKFKMSAINTNKQHWSWNITQPFDNRSLILNIKSWDMINTY